MTAACTYDLVNACIHISISFNYFHIRCVRELLKRYQVEHSRWEALPIRPRPSTIAQASILAERASNQLAHSALLVDYLESKNVVAGDSGSGRDGWRLHSEVESVKRPGLPALNAVIDPQGI